MKKPIILCLWTAFLFSCSPRSFQLISSPDNQLAVEVSVAGADTSALEYAVRYRGEVVIAPSKLGFRIAGQPSFEKNLKIKQVSHNETNRSWQPVYGEKSQITDHFNELVIRVQEKTSPHREMEVTFRVYNEGMAFRYRFLPQPGVASLVVEKENTRFSLPGDCACWAAGRAQAAYRKIPVSRLNELPEPAERPLVVELSENLFLAIGEAGLVDFARMKLTTADGAPTTLETALHGEATVSLPGATPWRFVMVGQSPGQLLENNYFLQNLNDPCALEEVSWIRPGKVIREVTLTTQGGKACVDFAADNGLQYVEFDAGWYGPENADTSDATTVTVDPARSPGPLDLHEVIRYAATKEIGILLYVNRKALERQIDTLLPLYHSWGVKGVKYGFVQVGSQQWTAWLHEAVKKAAQNQLMVDIHDEYRPTGFSRTYPNLLTQEGIRGDEESPSTEHTLVTLFTRMIAGAGDNTLCYFAPRVAEKMGGAAGQLAKSVLLYSPWQFLYWYDRPDGSPRQKGGAGSSVGIISDEPELRFWKELPVVWDDTRVLEGKIGDWATVVRKNGDNWWLGSLTAHETRQLSIPLTFLDSQSVYEAVIYFDDPAAGSRTQVGIRRETVTPESVLQHTLAANTGLAVSFRKIK